MVISCERILKLQRRIWEATNFLGAMSKTFFLLDGYLNPKQPTHTHTHLRFYRGWMENNRIAISPPTHQKMKHRKHGNFQWFESIIYI